MHLNFQTTTKWSCCSNADFKALYDAGQADCLEECTDKTTTDKPPNTTTIPIGNTTTATPTGNTTIPSLLTLRFQTQKNVLFITIPSSKGTRH